MKKLFTTAEIPKDMRFRSWREVCEERLVPMQQAYLGDQPFQASVFGCNIGGLSFTKFSLSNVRTSTTSRTIRHEQNKTDFLYLSIVYSGAVSSTQNDRSTVDCCGDLSVRDTNTPWLIEHNGYTEVLAIEIPRHSLESALGSARHFAGLNISGRSPTAMLARSFIANLLRLEDRLKPVAAERMATISVDLIVASLAERMAIDTPKALQGTLTMQRAISYIEANFGRVDLNPEQVAAATGFSLRHLQGLFHKSGRSISECIWQRRLDVAAHRLADPGFMHMPLGALAYGCGFASQSHFSTRFRERFELSPSDYRRDALSKTACGAQNQRRVL